VLLRVVAGLEDHQQRLAMVPVALQAAQVFRALLSLAAVPRSHAHRAPQGLLGQRICVLLRVVAGLEGDEKRLALVPAEARLL
jgi:hypothetical protein